MNSRDAKKLVELIQSTGIVSHWIVKNPQRKRELLESCKKTEPESENLKRIFDKTTSSISQEMKNLVACMFLLSMHRYRLSTRLLEIHAILQAAIPEVKTDAQWSVFCRNAYPNLVQEVLDGIEQLAYES